MSLPDCLFCKIVIGEIPSKKLAESPHAIAIADINPQAPFHALVLPKQHFASLNDLDDEARREVLPELFDLADRLARENRLRDGADGGYRTVINTGARGGQTVFHLHLHLLGGAQLKGRFGT